MKFEVLWKNPGYTARPELKEDILCDYLIVGGGITGVSAAYFLAKSGAKNIVLIEKHHIASGATGKAAGSLVTRGELDLLDYMKKYGDEEGRRFWNEILEALKGLHKITVEEGIDCDAELQDTLFCGSKSRHGINFRGEYEAEKSIEGSTRFLKGEEFKKELNTDLFTYGVLSKDHGLSVDPLKLTQGLARIVEKYGVTIYENTNLLRTDGGAAKTHHGTIRYKKLIMAIDVDHPAEEIKNVKTTIVVTRHLTESELAQTGLAKKKIVWDTKKNYYYFKLTKDKRILAGFGNIRVHKKHKKT